MARKSKLTPEVQEKILRYLRVGTYVETAAAAAGISAPSNKRAPRGPHLVDAREPADAVRNHRAVVIVTVVRTDAAVIDAGT